MKVPEEIRKVPRPEGTVVYAYGSDPVKYSVKKRHYVKVDGKVRQKDGDTVGHIINGEFVPVDERPRLRYDDSDFLYWADSQLAVNLSRDVLEDLRRVFPRRDADAIYAMAVLRTVEEHIKDDELKDSYDRSAMKLMFPDVALSKNVVGNLLFDIGRTCSHITEFTRLRASRIPENHLIAVDGMLKSDESYVNSFSEASYKARVRNTRDISVIYAFDVERMEPVCSSVYPGNMPDTYVFGEFLEKNGLTQGVVIVDKGFKYNSARKVFLDNPGLHFIIPLRRDSKVIDEYRMLSFDSSLANRNAVQCRKERMHDGRFLYSYRDVDIAKTEEEAWTNAHSSYDPAELEAARREFGTIVFVSDLDLPSEVVYAAYEERWELEVMFRLYKNILDFDETRVHRDQSVIGTEFVNLLSTIMACRLKKKFGSVEALRKKSYEKCKRFLRKGVLSRPTRDAEWLPSRVTASDEKTFIELGILKAPEVEKRRPGRPKKVRNRE